VRRQGAGLAGASRDKAEIDALSVDVHALDGEARDVVDRDVLQLGVLGPVLVEDEEKLLRSAEGEDGQKDAAAALEDRLDETCEARRRQEGGRGQAKERENETDP